MKIVISGFGAMGQVLLNDITKAHDLELCGVVDKMTDFGHNAFSELPNIPDVIIDFSHPSNLSELLDYATEHKVGIVLATTGMNELENSEIKVASKITPILYTGNTSLGINIMNQVVKSIASVLGDFDIEIIEKHHNQKVDAPSGTAQMLVNSVQEVRDLNVVYGRSGVSKRQDNDVTVHSVRGGSIAGEHTVLFAGEDELVEIKHTALSKRVFSKGAINAARYINDQKNGLYSMKDIF